ncbi:MAG TPA: DUF5052 domain-containing protein [Erysipelotrichaceae bacterium]|jgi:hypothetical protein|nr:DUF5052 domain-containing protein [Erysipelotrichaceae bacterium]
MNKKVSVLACTLMLAAASGCGSISQKVNDFNGHIFGNRYTIDTFDNYGSRVLTTHGSKIDISGNVVQQETYDNAADSTGYVNTLSSVITLTIDGHEMLTCGDTTIFYEDGLVPEVNFQLETIDSESSSITDSTLISGLVNKVKNKFGKQMVVVIKSQTGVPIYAFSGRKVTWSIPADLPKFTKLVVDGKALYLHRANFQIIDKELIDE